MKVEKRDGSIERRILIGMIVDNSVLSRISAHWEPGLMSSTWSNMLAKWCVDFHEKYDRAPKKAIEGIFESWASKSKDKDSIKLMEKFLDSLSGEYQTLRKESNSDYIIDIAAEHFNKVKYRKLAEAIQGDIDSGKAEEAGKRIDTFSRVEIGAGVGIDVLRDRNAIKDAFDRTHETLLEYPDPLGVFLDGIFVRDAFVSFMGPEKRGKSFWLQDIAWRGMQQGRKVAYFEVGDMSQSQVMMRFMVRASRHPLILPNGFPGSINYPVALSVTKAEGEYDFDLRCRQREFKKPLNWKIAWKACEKIITSKLKTKESLLRLSCHPNSTISVSGIKSILQSWERQDWVPDIVVIDYADILAPPAGTADTRDKINATWKQLRSLSQAMHCLVVTATQTDTGSYTVHTITRSNFSDDKRKLGHVTAMLGINQTVEEKEKGIMRINKIALRDGDYSELQCAYVAGCLAVGNPAVISYL